MLALREWAFHFKDEVYRWLSVQQCPECAALVVEDFMPDHLEWHRRENDVPRLGA
jgi:hypothetical protein